MKKPIIILLLTSVILFTACTPNPATPIPTVDDLDPEMFTTTPTEKSSTPTPQPTLLPIIERHPDPYLRKPSIITELPKFDTDSNALWQVDLRSSDLTELDLTQSLNDLLYADFDSDTLWPAENKMPPGFDWQSIMETGKNPGLEIRALHNEGITGKGVNIAIIDQTLLVDHQEYVDQIRYYEETENITPRLFEPQMHGAAVASIAVGKTVGVAPEANLYYIADWCVDSENMIDFSLLAKSVDRVLEINSYLAEGNKIRALVMATGWSEGEKGYNEIEAATQRAIDAGLLVISSNMEDTQGYKFFGLGRDPLANPDLPASYGSGLQWGNLTFDGRLDGSRLLIPMDSRTTASIIGVDKYVFYREGGWSWVMPYIAGMYALAVQVDPEITPDEFWSTALATGTTIQVEKDGKSYELGPILNPQELIEALK